jgi:hypothetical protein
MDPMGQDKSIATLRSRVSALVEKEGALLNQAFELSRAGGDRRGVDALFAQVQAIQVERNSVKKEIGNVLGTQRLHVASEVWRPGVYDYRQAAGGDVVRVRIQSGPIGLQVLMPGKRDAVNIDTLKGTFDGPLAVDDGAVHQQAAETTSGGASSPEVGVARKPRTRTTKKKQD